jgi:hypothetical protein
MEERWNAANPVVTTTDDGPGSIRSAMIAINGAGDPANTITFNLPAAESWDITLDHELVIHANVTVTGPGNIGIPLLTIHGSKAGSGALLRGNRVLTVGEGVSVTLVNLDLQGGAAPFYDPNGGLIKVLNAGVLTVRDSWLKSGSPFTDSDVDAYGYSAPFTLTGTSYVRIDAGMIPTSGTGSGDGGGSGSGVNLPPMAMGDRFSTGYELAA